MRGRRYRAASCTDELLRRALHDSVTALPGRELFIDEVRRSLATGGRASATQVVMFLRIEEPRHRRAAGGRSLADDVLAEIAGRLIALVRWADTVVRVGPAAFAVLVQASSLRDSDCLAARIAEGVRLPLLQHDPLALIASVGVAMASCGRDADQLVRMAEIAMVAAREAGGDCHRHFATSPDSV